MMDSTTLFLVVWGIVCIGIVSIPWIVTAITEELKAREETKRWTRIIGSECNRAMKSMEEMIRQMEGK